VADLRVIGHEVRLNEIPCVTVESSISKVFPALVFEFDIRADPYRFLLDEKKLRESLSFQELWPRHCPWINYEAADVLLSSVGSTSHGKLD
jgi:hypothetical protein